MCFHCLFAKSPHFSGTTYFCLLDILFLGNVVRKLSTASLDATCRPPFKTYGQLLVPGQRGAPIEGHQLGCDLQTTVQKHTDHCLRSLSCSSPPSPEAGKEHQNPIKKKKTSLFMEEIEKKIQQEPQSTFFIREEERFVAPFPSPLLKNKGEQTQRNFSSAQH